MVLHLFDRASIHEEEMIKEKILLKFGGSVITDKYSNVPSINNENLNKIGKLIDNSEYQLMIVHGAGSFGHPAAKKYKLSEGLIDGLQQTEGIEIARRKVRELNDVFCDILKGNGIEAEPVVPSQKMTTKGSEEITNFSKEVFDRILTKGKTPITFGDVTNDIKQGINILSGDVLMKYLAKTLKPRLSLFIMDLPGVFDGDPNDSNTSIIPLINSKELGNFENIFVSKNTDVTGGIIGKIKRAIEISNFSETWITDVDSLESCLKGDPKGTRVIF